MDNFVSVILKTKDLDENAIIEAMLGALDAPLAERVNQYGLFESDNDNVVLRLETPYELDDDESDEFAESFANRMFEMGYDDFEIETSLEETLDAKLNAAIKAINSQGSMWRKAKQGSINSKEIKTIQQALKQLGFDAGKADGWFGKKTAKAVRAFQKSKGLKVDGDPGPNTLKAMLNAVLSPKLDKKGATPKVVGKPEVSVGELPGSKDDKLSDVPPKVQTFIKGLDKVDTSGEEILPQSIADFGKVKSPKDVIKIGNDAIEKARQEDNLAQIAQIASASIANMPNIMTQQQKAELSKEIIKLVKPEEINDPKVKSAIAPAQLAVDVADAGTDEDEIQKALEKFVESTYPEAIPARLRKMMPEEDIAKRSMEVIVKKAQEEGLMSQFEDPSKAVKIIQEKVKELAKEGDKKKESIGNFEETYDGDDFYEVYGWIGAPDEDLDLWEAEYRGRKVKLNKPMQGDVKKFKVYVKNPKGNIVKVNFGDPNMRIKKSNPKRRKSFRARHNCDNPGPKTKARYWSCRKW